LHKQISIASEDVQNKRANRSVPRGLPLHKYANIYFTARNPMMYVLKDIHTNLVVLRISIDVLDIPNAVIADGNAASNPTAFYSPSDGLNYLDEEGIFAKDWTDPDLFEYWNKKRVKCAEVLIPDRVDPEFIIGAYVSSQESLTRVASLNLGIQLSVNKDLFFISA